LHLLLITLSPLGLLLVVAPSLQPCSGGAAVNLSFLFAATTVRLIGACSFHFENHDASSKKKDERLKQDVSEMETSLNNEV
jgi:hypothetical protein